MRKTARLIGLLFSVVATLAAREYGPAIGSRMPDFELRDQNGKTRTLKNVLGPKGAAILFFRSADW